MADGSIRLLDFGLAKLEDKNQNLTMAGVSLGKLAYVSPEQQLNAAKVNHRTDMYPLGVMFYEMLTGKLPDGKTTFSQLRPDLPKSCDAFVEKAMARDPEERFESARAFRHGLRDLYAAWEARKKPTEPKVQPVRRDGRLRRFKAALLRIVPRRKRRGK